MAKPTTTAQVQELVALLDPTTKVVTAADGEEYKGLIARWADNAIKPAGAVAVPKTIEEVSKLVKFASAHDLEMVVRGGGHSTGGTSSTAGGLVIDLSAMRSVTIDAPTKRIVAQGGALWADVDEAAATKGLATVGGTVNHTGVGGLTLGGGNGWLSGMYGAVVDNLVAAKVVVADGSILTASDIENTDLYWAIRGAGRFFGVTVEFTLQGHDQPNDVYAGPMIFTPDKLSALVDAMNARMDDPDPRGAAMLGFARPPDAPGSVVLVNAFFNGDKAAAEEYFAAVLALQPIAVMADMMPYRMVNTLLNPMATHGRRKALKTATFGSRVEPAHVLELWADYSAKVEENPDLSRTFLAIEFYDNRKIDSVPLDATSFANRAGYRAGIVGLYWTDPKGDEGNRAWGRSIQARCRNWILTAKDYTPSGEAIEYAGYMEPDDAMATQPFGANQTRVETLKQKYDPKSMFGSVGKSVLRAP